MKSAAQTRARRKTNQLLQTGKPLKAGERASPRAKSPSPGTNGRASPLTRPADNHSHSAHSFAANGKAHPTTLARSVESKSGVPVLGPRLLPAKAGDHAAIHKLLLSLFHGPSSAEFQAQLDEPLYEPTDRLLVKHQSDVVAHLRLTKRLVRLGPLQLPAAGFMDLATAPEYQGRGFASALLREGERQSIRDGAVLGLTRTTAPELFARHGWSVCGRHVFSTAGARQVLAHLRAIAPADFATGTLENDEEGLLERLALHEPRLPVLVRPLRRIEMPAFLRLYEQNMAGTFGSTIRTEPFWDWLMARHAFDRVFVAIVGTDSQELPQCLASVAGYAFVRDGRIVELMTRTSGGSAIAHRLVARVCADAIERNLHDVRLDAPPQHPLHQEFVAAGGQGHSCEEYSGEYCMTRLFDPLQTLRAMSGLLHERAKNGGLARPFQLGLEIYSHDSDLRQATHHDSQAYRLTVTSRSVKLTSGKTGRNYLALRRRDLTPILLGHWKPADAFAPGRLRASNRVAQEAAAILFPQLPWYRPPLDDLVA